MDTFFKLIIESNNNINEINNDIMRSSYINWFYSTERNTNEKEKLAHQMRHSIKTAQTNYLKIINSKENRLKFIILKVY